MQQDLCSSLKEQKDDIREAGNFQQSSSKSCSTAGSGSCVGIQKQCCPVHPCSASNRQPWHTINLQLGLLVCCSLRVTENSDGCMAPYKKKGKKSIEVRGKKDFCIVNRCFFLRSYFNFISFIYIYIRIVCFL